VSVPRLLPGTPPELVVYDRPQRCPYLHDRVARMPLRLPARPLDRHELDARLAAGDRRQGYVLYRTACPSCHACEPIRLDIGEFELGRTHKRILRRGDRALRVELGPPVVDARRIALYNAHKQARGLSEGQPAIDAEGYRDFLVSTCCDSFELRYRMGESLVGVAVVDRSANALSAVYCYYDPACDGLSVGTYSILKQVELSRRWKLRYLYLGLYIGECEAMAYKARFLPHERLLDGRWARFERSAPVSARTRQAV
jgi:arginyl-tRNA--protein-N-Asp/Glu arginylyltransferase